ncbi:MAG: ATP-binding protein [Bacillota bacterium]
MGETNEFRELRDALRALTVLRGVLDDAVIRRLCALLDALDAPEPRAVDAYAEFAAALFEHTENLSEYVLRLALEDVNPMVLRRAKGLHAGQILEQSVQSDLKTLQAASMLDAARVKERMGYSGFLPEWHTSEIDFAAEYAARLDALPKRGYGIWTKHAMFCLKDGRIAPVIRPDPVRLSGLIGYERQKEAIRRNTLALLSGKPAANALLFGDAGTGKSSTVKALVNEYAEQGLRLVEIRKDQFRSIPEVMEELAELPLKFILFIDDLSFTGEGDDFYGLKAVLEGGTSARAENTVIYATSNRRRLVREKFSDREGDDVHRGETLQELTSLSERFGLTVGFFKPGREEYLGIVRELAARQGIHLDGSELEEQAERFALGGRSPRIAQQFIIHLAAMEE